MKKIKKVIIALLALLLLISIAFGVLYTSAKYTSAVNGKVSASVAKWCFDVSGTDSYDSENNFQNLQLAQTCTPETLVDGKIAPGTSGSFEIEVDAAECEVGLDFVVSFSLADESKPLPKNLKFRLDGDSSWSYTDGIYGYIDANSGAPEDTERRKKTYLIEWEWPYNTDDDAADTAAGINAFDYSFNVQAVGTQVNPVSSN